MFLYCYFSSRNVERNREKITKEKKNAILIFLLSFHEKISTRKTLKKSKEILSVFLFCFCSFFVLSHEKKAVYFCKKIMMHELQRKEIENDMLEFFSIFVEERKTFLKQKISNSGKLDKSLELEIDATSRKDGVAMLIAFSEHGRYIDMKRLKPTDKIGFGYVAQIIDWLHRRGRLSKFVSKFMERRGYKFVRPTFLAQIAWGIALSRYKKKVRPKKWYFGKRQKSFNQFFIEQTAKMPIITSKILKEAIENGS